ncbi:MAG: hypothetical protein WBD00_03755 [Candidatus Omnitrophota bacterium]
MKSLLVVILLVLFFSQFLSAQDQLMFNRRGKERGYESTDDGATYYYDQQGRERGYSRNIDGQTLNFDRQGREKGYSETYDGTTYQFNKQGDVRGYTEDYSQDAVENEPADFVPGGAYWGVSGPPEKEDSNKEKEE